MKQRALHCLCCKSTAPHAIDWTLYLDKAIVTTTCSACSAKGSAFAPRKLGIAGSKLKMVGSAQVDIARAVDEALSRAKLRLQPPPSNPQP